MKETGSMKIDFSELTLQQNTLELTLGKIKPEEIQHWELSNFL